MYAYQFNEDGGATKVRQIKDASELQPNELLYTGETYPDKGALSKPEYHEMRANEMLAVVPCSRADLIATIAAVLAGDKEGLEAIKLKLQKL